MSNVTSKVLGKGCKPIDEASAVLLINPRFPHNVGAAQRAASCFGIKHVIYTGDRVALELNGKTRLPREERMKGFADVNVIQYDRPFELFDSTVVPVAVEVRPNAELLPNFVHPERALYVFGPEDGSLGRVELQHCHRFLVIPTRHCTNLAAAVNLILYDRMCKRVAAGREQFPDVGTVEQRGWWDAPMTMGESR